MGQWHASPLFPPFSSVARLAAQLSPTPPAQPTSPPPPAPLSLQAGARICKTLGQDFLPYLQLVMPPLLAAAQLKPDVIVRDEDDEDDEEEDGDVSCWVVSLPAVLPA